MSPLASRLLGELEDTTAHHGEIAQVIESETADDNNERRRNAMLKAISTRDRAGWLNSIFPFLCLFPQKWKRVRL
ncbi:MAG: hypothetical protein ABF443_00160 [Acetobacter malorum]|uniref:hypothetical protein n=1 Tax=Acetobacter malorum TaxID=178901 RepID=UPI0039ECC70C